MGNRVKIGVIGIDAGLCWIGDPCYVLHQETPPKAIGKNWDGFCKKLFHGKKGFDTKQFKYDNGAAGLGVVVSTGYGDGIYPVYVEYGACGRIVKVWVEFLDEKGEEPTHG